MKYPRLSTVSRLERKSEADFASAGCRCAPKFLSLASSVWHRQKHAIIVGYGLERHCISARIRTDIPHFAASSPRLKRVESGLQKTRLHELDQCLLRRTWKRLLRSDAGDPRPKPNISCASGCSNARWQATFMPSSFYWNAPAANTTPCPRISATEATYKTEKTRSKDDDKLFAEVFAVLSQRPPWQAPGVREGGEIDDNGRPARSPLADKQSRASTMGAEPNGAARPRKYKSKFRDFPSFTPEVQSDDS